MKDKEAIHERILNKKRKEKITIDQENENITKNPSDIIIHSTIYGTKTLSIIKQNEKVCYD